MLAINGMEVDGMSDIEAHALLAKCEQCVELEIVKGAFLWRGKSPFHLHSMTHLADVFSHVLLSSHHYRVFLLPRQCCQDLNSILYLFYRP